MYFQLKQLKSNKVFQRCTGFNRLISTLIQIFSKSRKSWLIVSMKNLCSLAKSKRFYAHFL